MLEQNQKEAIRARLKKAGDNHHPFKLSSESKDAMILEYIGGASARSLAEKYGVTPQTVSYHLRKAAGL